MHAEQEHTEITVIAAFQPSPKDKAKLEILQQEVIQ